MSAVRYWLHTGTCLYVSPVTVARNVGKYVDPHSSLEVVEAAAYEALQLKP